MYLWFHILGRDKTNKKQHTYIRYIVIMYSNITFHLSIMGHFSCLFSVIGVYVGVRAKDVDNTGLDAYFDAGLVTSLMVSSRTRSHEVKNLFFVASCRPEHVDLPREHGAKRRDFRAWCK